MNFNRRTLLKHATLPMLGAGFSFAQDATFSSDVKVVNVLATVRTKGGEIVQDLEKEDFILTESGRAQKIKYFSRETNLPLVLGLLVDTSGSQRMVLGEEQEASFRFLDTVLREDLDRTFVVHFDYRPEVLQNITTSKLQLQASLERLTLPYTRRGAGGTTLYDAVYLCSILVTKIQTGRNALILLTDGEDIMRAAFSLEDAIDAAQRADTLIYSILFSDASFGGGHFGSDGKGVLQKMSRSKHRRRLLRGSFPWKNVRSMPSINNCRKNYAINTASATHRTTHRVRLSAASISRPGARAWWSRRDPATTFNDFYPTYRKLVGPLAV